MSENPTISLANNDSENRHFTQASQYREASLKDESIYHGDTPQSYKDLREQAVDFLKNYTKIDDTFPLNTLKQSNNLKAKHYKQSVYYGEFHNGRKHGMGIMIYKNSRIYQGQWSGDQKSGYGAQKFPNGCYFKGQYLNGKPSGAGSYSWPNGQCYDGEWLNGFKHGSGMWRGVKGDSYKGEWRFGKPQGYGVHTWPNGDTYQGQFKQCLKHGQGIQKFANGDIYKGHYINGKPSGYGEYYWANGSFFKGNFINGLRDGKGRWKKAAGPSDCYDGHYKNDKKWGYGQFIWLSGNVYKGQYEGDLRNGFGQMYWTNGTYYKGNWLNGIQHGEGEIYSPQVGYKKGIFDNNVIVQIWEERDVDVDHTKVANKHRKTAQNGEMKRNKTSFRSRGAVYKKLNESSKNNNKRRYISHKQTQSKQLKNSENQWSRDANCLVDRRLRTNRNLIQQNKMFSAKQVNDKQKVNTSLQSDFYKNGNSVKHQSRDRLLHSSFYLYKLNMRHNMETLKSFKKNEMGEAETNRKPAMLFRGKLGQV